MIIIFLWLIFFFLDQNQRQDFMIPSLAQALSFHNVLFLHKPITRTHTHMHAHTYTDLYVIKS